MAGRQEGDKPGRTRREKSVNKIITYRRREGMIYVGIDLHKKTAQIAAMDEHGKVLTNRRIPHTRSRGQSASLIYHLNF